MNSELLTSRPTRRGVEAQRADSLEQEQNGDFVRNLLLFILGSDVWVWVSQTESKTLWSIIASMIKFSRLNNFEPERGCVFLSL